MRKPDWHSPRELLSFIFHSTKLIVVFVIGVALVLLGLALIPVPGPFTIPLVVAGLAVLASEFVWAERMLDTVKDRTKRATAMARRTLFKRGRNDSAA